MRLPEVGRQIALHERLRFEDHRIRAEITTPLGDEEHPAHRFDRHGGDELAALSVESRGKWLEEIGHARSDLAPYVVACLNQVEREIPVHPDGLEAARAALKGPESVDGHVDERLP